MARSVLGTLRPMADYPAPVETTVGTVIPEEIHVLFPPGGMDMSANAYNIPANVAQHTFNMVPYRDSWRSRHGTARIGDTTTSILLHARNFTTSAGANYTIRWTDTGVEYLDGSTTWRAMTGPTLTGNEATRIAETAWGDLLIFSNGVDGMHAINFTSKTYSLITNAPSACHLSTFNRRVVASVVATGRIQWCTAGDYTNWTATELGAGYEDLLSSEASTGAEQQSAVIPVSDEVAYAIRSGSIWQMVPTRQVGNPFAFSLLVATSGSRWPNSCCAIPGGAAFMSDLGIFLLRGGQLTEVSGPISSLWKDSDEVRFSRMAQHRLREACLIYSPIDEALFFSDGNAADTAADLAFNFSSVYRYHIPRNVWSVERYYWPIKSMSAATDRSLSTIGDFGASATIADFSPLGVIGDLGVSQYQYGVMYTRGYVSGSTNRFVARQAPERSRTPDAFDVLTDGSDGSIDSFADVITHLIRPRDASRVTHIHDVTLVYQASVKTAGTHDMQYGLSVLTPKTTAFSVGPATLPTPTQRFETTAITVPVNRQCEMPYLAIIFYYPCELRLLDVIVRVSEGARISETRLP